jgi:hypothetical protein
MSVDEIQLTWYTSEERKKARSNNRRTKFKNIIGSPIKRKSNNDPCKGDTLMEKARNRIDLLAAALRDQDRQLILVKGDPGSLKNLRMRRLSSEHRPEAHSALRQINQMLIESFPSPGGLAKRRYLSRAA